MIYGLLVWIGLVLVTIFAKTYAYVDGEAKKGVGRLIGVIIGSVVVVLLIIVGLKLIIHSI